MSVAYFKSSTIDIVCSLLKLKILFGSFFSLAQLLLHSGEQKTQVSLQTLPMPMSTVVIAD